MILGENEIHMKFFNRSKHDCQNICQLYKATKTITSEGVINQFKCNHCNNYLFPGGVESSHGEKICKCCGNNVVYVRSIKDDPDVKETKKSIPNSFTKETFGRKSFEELLEFIEDKSQLRANYQLVVLKFMIGSKMSEKIKIAEELTYQNNKNFNDQNEVKKFLLVPVYDVLEHSGFIKNIIHNGKEQYILNIEMNEFESVRVIELLDKKLKEYNLEHDIPENQYDDMFSEVKIVNDNSSYTNQVTTKSEKIESTQNLQNFWIWSTTPKNWEILKTKHVWGSRVPKDRISNKVKEGDLVAFYVIGTNSFKGVYEFASDWFDSPGKTWDDDLEPNGKLRYVSQIKILPIAMGLVELSQLYEKMELFKDKPTNIRNSILQGGSGYPSNNAKSLSESDFQEIITEFKNHQEPPVIDDLSLKVVESENETITIIENYPSGIRLKEFTEIKSEEIHKGQILSNDELINKFGVGNMGGIRHSKKNNILVLCSTLSKDYTDTLDPKSGLYVYSGEGQTGDQELTKGNKKILDSEYTMLFLQEKYQEQGARKRGALDNLYEFVGSVNYVKHFWVDEKDKDGNLRKVVKFVLEVES